MTTDKELEKIKQLLDSAEINIRAAKNLLFSAELSKNLGKEARNESNVVEGVFTGEAMIGEDKKVYPVSANYASKSKLVCGDMLKLTILDDGTFLFKQIGPVKRKKMIGELVETGESDFVVRIDDSEYRVLPASVTYFKAKSGDKLTILVPEDSVSEWAAVENLVSS